MGNLTGKYDPNAEMTQSFECLPTGEYKVQIVDGDVKETKGGTGEYAEFTSEVMEGPHAGRKIWTRFTLSNPNSKAVEIGNRQMATLRHACGVPDAQDTKDFMFRPHIIRVEFYGAGSVIGFGQKKGQLRDRDENDVRDWKAIEGANAGAAPYARPAQPAANTAAPADGRPHWAKPAA